MIDYGRRVKMFRGQWKITWATALVKAGWPDPQARRMADFLVGELPEVPTWAEMTAMEHGPPSSHRLVGVQRYEFDGMGGMGEDARGDYVRHDDMVAMMVPPSGVEPELREEPDFESGASTNSAKGA